MGYGQGMHVRIGGRGGGGGGGREERGGGVRVLLERDVAWLEVERDEEGDETEALLMKVLRSRDMVLNRITHDKAL